jgi:hypothetical protein
MGKRPQSRFRRLVLVGPSEQPRHHFLHSSHWGDAHTPAVSSTRAEFKALRMAVMPTFSRGIWLEALSAMGKFVRSYFHNQPRQKRGAVILSFRRPGFRGPQFQPGSETGYVTKKASTGVCWNSDQTPKEGGRA